MDLQTVQSVIGKPVVLGKSVHPKAKDATVEAGKKLLAIYRAERRELGKFSAFVEGLDEREVVGLANYYLDTLEADESKGIIAVLRTTLERINKEKGADWTITKPKGSGEYVKGARRVRAPRQATAPSETVEKAKAGVAITKAEVIALVVQFATGLVPDGRDALLEDLMEAVENIK